MSDQKVSFKSEKELREVILKEKARGVPDLEIGQKYGVTFRYIERLITKSQGVNVSTVKASKKVKTLSPKDFEEEQNTVWSFKQRGNWATHSGEYRGNWSPYIPRNVILKYSKPGELVLDCFCGAGTTAVEAKLLGRRCIAFDINDKAIDLAKENTNFNIGSQQSRLFNEKSYPQIYEPELSVGDARDLSFLQDSSIDLICAHPPYANIVHYTDSTKDDLSSLDIDDFLKEMSRVAKESFRVLKPGRQCAILIGDTRRKKHVIPLGFKLMNVYLNVGFELRELIIKRQHNCKTTGFWYANSIKYNFLLLAHEYLPIFEKPETGLPKSVTDRKAWVGDKSSLVFPTVEKPSARGKLEQLETTTVWILPEKDFEERLNKNVIDRYSNEDGYSTITFVSHSENETICTSRNEKKGNGLLFIKSPFLKDNSSHLNIEYYLKEIEKIAEQDLPDINKNGFFVIQTHDVRIDGYVEPLAVRIVDLLKCDRLWLKEVVVITQPGRYPGFKSTDVYLKITHQYLLVYEIV